MFRTVKSTTIGASDQDYPMSTGGGKTEVETKGKFFPGTHYFDFIFNFILTQREVRWGAQVKEPGGDKRHRSH